MNGCRDTPTESWRAARREGCIQRHSTTDVSAWKTGASANAARHGSTRGGGASHHLRGHVGLKHIHIQIEIYTCEVTWASRLTAEAPLPTIRLARI